MADGRGSRHRKKRPPPGEGGIETKRVARADTGEDAVVVEPVVGIVQVELAVLSVAVQVHDATVAVRVQPRNVRKVICATASRYRAKSRGR